MRKIALSASIIRNILTMIDSKDKPLSYDDKGTPAPIIQKLKDIVGDKDDDTLFDFELPSVQYFELKHIITGIGENMITLGMLL